MNILIVGSGARELAIIRALSRSPSPINLFCYGTTNNPGISVLTKQCVKSTSLNSKAIVKQAQDWRIDLAIIGPEGPLAEGLADQLTAQNIATVGPKQALARIEYSKSFTRNLLKKYQISGSPRYQLFTNLQGVKSFLQELGDDHYVIKADGLMGGKGVKVAGDHLHSLKEAYQFCQELHQQNIPFLIEEKLIGQEFSFLCFADGKSLIPMPLVQDHKRAFVHDKGPNTGGMGSYSDANHSLPFLTAKDIIAAAKINESVMEALQEECGDAYRGILYGSFMATAKGIYLIEYNARFGDPEALNILSILESDFVSLCHDLAHGKLSPKQVHFKALATVCKYAVPLGYPDQSIRDSIIDISKIKNKALLYYAHIDEVNGQLITRGSRALAVTSAAPTIAAAEAIVEEEISRIEGPVYHRQDIGKPELIKQRIEMMRSLRQQELCLS